MDASQDGLHVIFGTGALGLAIACLFLQFKARLPKRSATWICHTPIQIFEILRER